VSLPNGKVLVVVVVVIVVGGGSSVSQQLNLIQLVSGWCVSLLKLSKLDCIICPVITSLPLATYMHTKQPAYAGTIDSGE